MDRKRLIEQAQRGDFDALLQAVRILDREGERERIEELISSVPDASGTRGRLARTMAPWGAEFHNFGERSMHMDDYKLPLVASGGAVNPPRELRDVNPALSSAWQDIVSSESTFSTRAIT